MSISEFLQEAISWLAWSGLGLGLITIIAFLIGWGARFRLVGATVFTLLLSGSCWAFKESYSPPIGVEGALYVPVVYDNGADLVVAQAPEDFPNEAIQPSLEQIARNLKGGGRNEENVHVRIRKIESTGPGVSQPIILGEVIKNNFNNKIIPISIEAFQKNELNNEPDDSQSMEVNDLEDESLNIEKESQTKALIENIES